MLAAQFVAAAFLGPTMAQEAECPRDQEGRLHWPLRVRGAMVEDLNRFLQHIPIDACPPSRTYAALQFVRRHRGPVFAGTGLLLVLATGAEGTTIGMKRALDAKEELVWKNRELDAQKLVLVDYKERLSGLLESNQGMLRRIGRMGTSETNLAEDIEALRKNNQTLLDQVRNEVENQERYAEQIENQQRAKAQLEELARNQGSENADLKSENERLLAKLTELQASLSLAIRHPAGQFAGPVTFSYPVTERKGLRSVRVVDFGVQGETVTFTSVAHPLDASGQETGVPKKSAVELIGAWDGSVFHSVEQRVISTDFATWSPEEIRLSYSVRTNRIDWISTFKYAGNTVVGKGVLTPVSE